MLIRRSNERGYANHGWLEAKHSFSFAHYYDPRYMGFKSLRVINEDKVSPLSGFGTHPHNNMEIITYIIEGELTHEDSMGIKSKILPGEIQVMSAGNGVEHSEHNESENERTHLLQIWLLPDSLGGAPSYDQANYHDKLTDNTWLTLVSGTQGNGLVKIKQEASLNLLRQEKASPFKITQDPEKAYWLQVVKGKLKSSGKVELQAGDAIAWEQNDESLTHWESSSPAELLLFEFNDPKS